MIQGIGTDIVELTRLKRINLEKFIQRILTKSEQEYLPKRIEQQYQFLAGRFAAKEAIAKALGTGIGVDFSFQDVSIIPDQRGKPQVTIGSDLQERYHHFDSFHIHLSISHSDQHAIAMVIIEQVA